MSIRETITASLLSQEQLKIIDSENFSFGVSPIRFHHLATYCQLTQGFGGWNDISVIKPWEQDDKTRNAIATKIAYAKSNQKIVDWKIAALYASQDEPIPFAPNISYIHEVLGHTDEETRIYQQRIFAVYFNFLNSLDKAGKKFLLSEQPDHICSACINQKNGFGLHCTAIELPEEDKDLAVRTRLVQITNQNLFIHEDDNVYITSKGFFDIQVMRFANFNS